MLSEYGGGFNIRHLGALLSLFFGWAVGACCLGWVGRVLYPGYRLGLRDGRDVLW